MHDSELREGEITLPFDPAVTAADAKLVFIGRIRSPWRDRATCPHNLREARERGGGGTVELRADYLQGLAGVERHGDVHLLYWLDQARRDLIIARPRRAETVSGVFALRSPVRPNPIGLALVRVLSVDFAAGWLSIDAIDCLDGTPLIDIKPHRPGVDNLPGDDAV